MNLNQFMREGVNGIMKTVGRSYLSDKTGRSFLLDMLPRIKKSALLRERNEAEGTHVPPFLIASIASQCNLHCAGCYARSGGTCSDGSSAQDLGADEWGSVFSEASELGVSFVLLAGGEPLMRRDIINVAARQRDMIFPVFTNGTMIDDDYLSLFEECRNVVPVLSIEGDAEATDRRRGFGVHREIEKAMGELKQRKILFGTSITVTKDTLHEVTSPEFLSNVRDKGCGVTFYVEYVPTEAGSEHLTLSEDDLAFMASAIGGLKERFGDVAILSFPGDEEAMGGCLASGRGFFHINPHGGAEPCPFSPYAKHNVRNDSLKAILRSQYFSDIRTISAQAGPHTGGCVLFKRENEVRALMAG